MKTYTGPSRDWDGCLKLLDGLILEGWQAGVEGHGAILLWPPGEDRAEASAFTPMTAIWFAATGERLPRGESAENIARAIGLEWYQGPELDRASDRSDLNGPYRRSLREWLEVSCGIEAQARMSAGERPSPAPKPSTHRRLRRTLQREFMASGWIVHPATPPGLRTRLLGLWSSIAQHWRRLSIASSLV